MKKELQILLFVLFTFASSAFGQFITGGDNADNYSQDGYPAEGNLGTGFGAWYSYSDNGGWFRGSATGNGASNSSILNTNGNAFGMWGGTVSDVGRNFSSLNTGDKLSFSFSFQWDNGNKGFDLSTGGVGTNTVFNFNLTSTGYTWTGGGSQTMTSWDVPPGDRQNGVVISVVITQTTTGLDYNIQAAAGDGGFGTKTGSITFSGNINALKFYVSSAGGSGGNLYFNNLQIEVADPANVASTANVRIIGNVDLAADESLTVNNLTVDESNTLTIKSTSSGTGSLIVNGTISGDVTVERYLTNYGNATDAKYHFISSPVTSQKIQDVMTGEVVTDENFVTDPPTTGVDFYKFDEPTNYWINTKAGDGAWNSEFEDNFVVGRGYMVAYPALQTKSFTGTLNSYSVASPLVINCTHNADKGKGWNLIGNPFPSAIDWTTVVKGEGMDNALYYYDASLQNYRYYIQLSGETTITTGEGSRYIPAMQGFMVHAKTSGTQTITIDNDDRVHQAQTTFYKSSQLASGVLSLTVNSGEFEDVAIVHFTEGATAAFDGDNDAYKLFSYNTAVPQVYTMTENNELLAINGLPEISKDLRIPVHFIAGIEGDQVLTADVSQIGVAVTLMDRTISTSQNLTENPVYVFNASPDDNPDRFELLFGVTGLSDNTALATLRAYVSHGQLTILGESGELNVDVLDMQGRVLERRAVQMDGSYSQPLNLPAGVYVVRVYNGQDAKSVKVILTNR